MDDGKFGGSFPDIVYPAPLQTPRIDFDEQRRKRIASWLEHEQGNNAAVLYGGYDGEVDNRDLAEVLLKFEKFLMEEEARRIQQ